MNILFHIPRRLFGLADSCLAMALVVALALPSQSRAADYSFENAAEISMLPGWRTNQGSHMAALHIELAEGWKTYWRAPGEGGISPTFDWAGSRNLHGVAFHWPVPQVFDVAGIQTLGYAGALTLPIEVFPKATGQEITLSGRVFLGVCRDVCMPVEARFHAVLPAAIGAEALGRNTVIRQALDNQPATARAAGMGSISCDIGPIADGLRVTATLGLPRVGPNEMAVVEPADPSIWVSAADVTRRGGTLTVSADLVAPSGMPFVLARSDIRLTVLAGGRGVDIASCVQGG